MANFLRSSRNCRRAYGSVSRATGSGMTAGTRRTSLFGTPAAAWAAAEASGAVRQRTTVHGATAAATSAADVASFAEPRHRYSTSLLRAQMAQEQALRGVVAQAAAGASSGASSKAEPAGPPVLRVKVSQMNSFTWAWQTMLELLVVFVFLHSVVIPIITFMIEKPLEALMWMLADAEEEA